MAALLEHHSQAVKEFSDRVHAVGPHQWAGATPCTDWDVRALVNHLVNEQLWVPPLMSGATIAEVGDTLDGDLLGEDPVAAWDAAAAAATDALRSPGALERVVHLSFADVTGQVYAWQLISDLAVHAWDLAQAIGVDPTIDEELAATVIVKLTPDVVTYAQYGLFAPAQAVPENASAQDRLLALTGRHV